MRIDATDIAVAKAALRRAPKLPDVTFRGIPIEADVFDFDDLLAMLSISLDTARRERTAHDATMGVFRTVAKSRFGAEAVELEG